MVHDKRASWVVPILRHLERQDLYEAWTKASPVALPLPKGSSSVALVAGKPNPWSNTNLGVLVCPSGPDVLHVPDPLSYVVNCGSARTANDFLPPLTSPFSWVEDRNSGVFFNRARADFNTARPTPNPPAEAFVPESGPVVTLDFIRAHDGASCTLLLSENLQATRWATDPTDTLNDPPNPFQSEFQVRQNTGFVWFVTGNKNNGRPASAGSLYNPAGIGVNELSARIAPPVPLRAYPVPGQHSAHGRPGLFSPIIAAPRRRERVLLRWPLQVHERGN